MELLYNFFFARNDESSESDVASAIEKLREYERKGVILKELGPDEKEFERLLEKSRKRDDEIWKDRVAVKNLAMDLFIK